MRPALKKLSDLRPLEEAHRNQYYLALLEHVRRFGLRSSLLVTEDGVVVDGCRRLAILSELGTRSYVEVNVIDEDLSEEGLRVLRAELHVLHRSPSFEELRLFSGTPIVQPLRDEPSAPSEIESLIEELLSAKGVSARLIQAVARHMTVVVPHPEIEGGQETFNELSDLLRMNGRRPWK